MRVCNAGKRVFYKKQLREKALKKSIVWSAWTLLKKGKIKIEAWYAREERFMDRKHK